MRGLMRLFLTAMMVLTMGIAQATAASENAAPKQKEPETAKQAAPPAAEEPAGEEAAAPAEGAPAAAPQQNQPAGAAQQKPTGDNLDVTITGEAKDELPVDKPVPSLEVPFRETVTL